MQERLTGQVADALVRKLEPRGVIVVIDAEHLCMGMRGIRKPGSRTTTSAVRGMLQSLADVAGRGALADPDRVSGVAARPAPPRLPRPGPLRGDGVLNVTPDSFSDGGRFLDRDHAVAHGVGDARRRAPTSSTSAASPPVRARARVDAGGRAGSGCCR